MSLRAFVGLVGGLMLAAGLVFLVTPITLTDSIGRELSCGSAIASDQQAAKDYYLEERRRQLEGTLDPVIGQLTSPGSTRFGPGVVAVAEPDCDRALSTRRMWAISLAVAGAVVMFGALVVRGTRRS